MFLVFYGNARFCMLHSESKPCVNRTLTAIHQFCEASLQLSLKHSNSGIVTTIVICLSLPLCIQLHESYIEQSVMQYSCSIVARRMRFNIKFAILLKLVIKQKCKPYIQTGEVRECSRSE